MTSALYVAGHAGLVGSAIVRQLESRGAGPLLTAPRRELELTDPAAVDAFFARHRPRAVVLAAAKVGGIQANAASPVAFLQDNLRIELNVIDAAARHGAERLLFLASTCVYPKQCPQPMKPEYLGTGPIEPTNEPYAVAKIAGIKLCQAYRRQAGKCFTSVIAANAYGPGDRFDDSGHVISSLVARFHQAKRENAREVVVWGTGTPRREFLYVDDLADACCLLLEQEDPPDVVNVGSGEEITVADLSERIRRIAGFPGAVRFDPSRPDGLPRRLLDSAHLKSLGWKPKVPLDPGLRWTTAAYLSSQ